MKKKRPISDDAMLKLIEKALFNLESKEQNNSLCFDGYPLDDNGKGTIYGFHFEAKNDNRKLIVYYTQKDKRNELEDAVFNEFTKVLKDKL